MKMLSAKQDVEVAVSKNNITYTSTLPKSITQDGTIYRIDWTSVVMRNDGHGYYTTTLYKNYE